MLYRKTTLTLDVKASLSSKEIQRNNGQEISNGEVLIARTGKKKEQKHKNQEKAKKRAKKQIRRKSKGSVFTAEKKATILEIMQRKIKGRIKKIKICSCSFR